MVDSFYRIKDLTKTDSVQFKDLPLPLIAFMMGFWFTENFKSITLKTPLSEVFDELVLEYVKPDVNDFVGDFKLFLLAATLAHKNIADDTKFMNLIDRDSFVKNPVLMVVGDLFLETDAVQKKSFDPEIKKVITKQIRHHIKALKYILKEPAYRFNDNYSLIHKGDSDEDNNTISTFENDIHDD